MLGSDGSYIMRRGAIRNQMLLKKIPWLAPPNSASIEGAGLLYVRGAEAISLPGGKEHPT